MYFQKVIIKKLKIAGSGPGSGSVSQRYGSADLDPGILGSGSGDPYIYKIFLRLKVTKKL